MISLFLSALIGVFCERNYEHKKCEDYLYSCWDKQQASSDWNKFKPRYKDAKIFEQCVRFGGYIK